ncbi:Cell division protein ZapA-like protein [mine drainage metagenome]|uniref:Cell division protein ZapA n=2 Tax=mine drainage metagenome TaxID=410659 RepID=T0Z198_9ZZZZ
MTEDPKSVTIRILDREFQVSCPESERLALLEAAALLHDRMQEIRTEGKLIGLDRIAIMAALNLAHQLLAEKRQANPLSEQWLERIHLLNEQLAAHEDQANRMH